MKKLIIKMLELKMYKVYLEAIKSKIKKILNSKYDPYEPLPSKTFLSPSLNIFENYKTVPTSLAFINSQLTPKEWQIKARNKLSELSGYERKRALPKITQLNKEINIGNDIYKQSIYLRVSDKSDIPIKLLYKKPFKRNFKVFIFLAGSSSGAHVGIGEIKVPIDRHKLQIGADIARQAAKKNYLAVTIEQAGYGERLEKKLLKKSSDRTIDNANQLLLLGKSLVGNGATEISNVIDWLVSKKNKLEVNKNKIFLFGHSSGGTLSQYAAALDTRIKGTLASGSVGPIRETLGARGCGSGEGIVPGFLKWFDTSDVIALIAPRVFVGLSGDKDHIFPYNGLNKVVKTTKKFYKKLNASNKIKSIKVKGQHKYYSKKTWEVWNKYIDPI